jgi:hypothetical protein
MPFTNTEAAAYGVLAMYAMDMYRVQEDPLTPPTPDSLTPPPYRFCLSRFRPPDLAPKARAGRSFTGGGPREATEGLRAR